MQPSYLNLMQYVPNFKPESIAFETEAKLVNLFEFIIGHGLDSKSGLLREFDGVDGVADLILFDLYKNFESNLLGEVSPRWAYALRAIPYRKNFTTDDFSFATGLSKQTATNALMKFVSLGYCKKGLKTQSWIKIKQPRLLVKKIFAIEAKLKDWRKALSQAIRYRDYAHQSWVLLDEFSAKAAIKNIDAFTEINIGLASINSFGIVNIHYAPSILKPKSEIRLWQANAEIAKRIKLGF